MGSLGLGGKPSCPPFEVLIFPLDSLSPIVTLMHFHSLDLNEFDLDLQVRPDDVCSQVGLCTFAKRDQSKRLGSSPFFSFLFSAQAFLYINVLYVFFIIFDLLLGK